MDELDKDVASLLGIDPQALETQPHEAAQSPRAPRRRARRLAMASAAVVAVAALSALSLTIVRPLPSPHQSARVAAAPKLDVLLDRQATSSAPEQSVQDLGDATGGEAIILPHHKAEAQLAQATTHRHEPNPLRKGRHSLNDALQIARADAPRAAHRATGHAPAETVDFFNQTRTASEVEAQKTLVEDRLEAIDAIRLLRQR